MNRSKVLQVMEYVKGSPETMDYGRWGALNPEQRHFIAYLCESWLILDGVTNLQTKEIERLNKQIEEYQKALDETTSEKIDLENIIKEVREYIDKYSRYCSNKEYFSTRNPITDLKIILDKEVN